VTTVDNSVGAPVVPMRSTGGRPYASLPELGSGWWPVAHGVDLQDKPVAVRIANTSLALYRDASGTAQAVLDRCPHRRMPLSLGRITRDGLIQCGYHGWSFNGAGQCEVIPNFRPGERPSGRIVVYVYAVSERGGLVLVHSRGLVDDPLPKALSELGETRVAGRLEVRSPHQSVVAALALNPGAALGLGPLLGAGDQIARPVVDSDRHHLKVVRERLTFNLPRLSTFDTAIKRPTRATIDIRRDTGLAVATSEFGRGSTARLVVGASPIGPYRTSVFWQLNVTGPGGAGVVAAVKLSQKARARLGQAANTFAAVADNADMTFDPVLEELKAGTKA
jgi:nitrite reductase/ring-hydroxylating ferredoxin subunit